MLHLLLNQVGYIVLRKLWTPFEDTFLHCNIKLLWNNVHEAFVPYSAMWDVLEVV